MTGPAEGDEDHDPGGAPAARPEPQPSPPPTYTSPAPETHTAPPNSPSTPRPQDPLPGRIAGPPYGAPPRASGWTGGSPSALPPLGPIRLPAGAGVPERPAPPPPPRPDDQDSGGPDERPGERPDPPQGIAGALTSPSRPPTATSAAGSVTAPTTGGTTASPFQGSRVGAASTTVVPGRRSGPSAAAPRPPMPQGPRPVRGRKARLALRRVDPWSVFVVSLLLSLFLAVMTIVAAVLLYVVLDAAGIPASINKSVSDVKGGTDVLTQGRFLGVSALLAAANVVLLTLLSTLGALLYNLCASFTGGLEVTLAERD